MTQSKKILIFSTASGFCHNSTSDAIRKILDDVDITIDVVEFYDLFGNLKIPFYSKQYSIPELYNKYVQQKGNTGLFWIFSCIIFAVVLKLRSKSLNYNIDKLLTKTKPDMVISIIPFVNKILCKRLDAYSKDLSLHTIVVDFCEPFPQIWLQSKRQVIYGWNEKLISQANRFGIASSNIINLGGQLISPELKKITTQKKFDIFKVLVVFGGNGSKRILKYAKELEKTDDRIQISYIIGNSIYLNSSLREIVQKDNSTIYSFISDIKEIYSNTNLIIGKPGPSIISESIYSKTPLLLELNRKTLIQERYNAKWAKASGVALLFKTTKDLKSKLLKIAFEPLFYEQLKLNTYSINNNSFDIFKKSVIKALN